MKNRKVFFICIVFAFCVCGVFANDGENSKKKLGLEVGLNLNNQYAIGDFSEYAKATFGGEVFVNYVLPKKIVKIENLGVNAAFGIAKVFPNGNYVEKFSQNYFSFGAFYLINLTKNFQLKPQLNLGMINHKFVGGYEMKNNYSDFMISASCDLRYLWKYNLIFNVSPVYTFVPVKDGTINYFGVKFGASYRF
jgi:hypothetical protein